MLATQRMPLDHLEAMEVCSPLEHCTESRLKHTPSLSKKEAYFLSRSFGMTAGFWFDTVLGGYRGAFINQK